MPGSRSMRATPRSGRRGICSSPTRLFLNLLLQCPQGHGVPGGVAFPATRLVSLDQKKMHPAVADVAGVKLEGKFPFPRGTAAVSLFEPQARGLEVRIARLGI